jgi:hypothetical protein
MTSKISEAIQQTENSIETLKNGIVEVDKTIREKQKQIRELRAQSLACATDVFAGVWKMRLKSQGGHVFTDAVLHGWTCDYGAFKGTTEGNALAQAAGLLLHEWDADYKQIDVPYGRLKDSGDSYFSVGFSNGKISIAFRHLSGAEIIQFMRERKIEITYDGDFGIDTVISQTIEKLDRLVQLSLDLMNADVVHGDVKPENHPYAAQGYSALMPALDIYVPEPSSDLGEGEFQSSPKEKKSDTMDADPVWNMLDSLRFHVNDFANYVESHSNPVGIVSTIASINRQVNETMHAFEKKYNKSDKEK